MQLTYYNNRSDKRKLSKDITQIALQDHPNPVTISILDETSIVNPTFKMVDKDLYLTANYCYVDTLRRYYFINDIKLANGFAYLSCSVDVLMSYKEQLKATPAVIKRQESSYNTYIVDDKLCVLNYEGVRIVEFPQDKGFDENTQQFVMCCIGNTNQ